MISFIERAQDYNNTDIQLTDGFKELFSDIKNSMNDLFTEQNNNIKEINKQISQLSNFKSDVNKLSIEISKQNDKIDSISNGNLDPFQNFKISKSLKWLLYCFLILGIISFIYPLITIFFK